MVKVKICGIKTRESLISASKGDFVGFILKTPSSKRNIELDYLKELLRNTDISAKKVAVTVTTDKMEISEILNKIDFDFIQIHNIIKKDTLFDIKEEFGIKIFYTVTKKNIVDLFEMKNSVEYFLFDSGFDGGKGIENDWNFLSHIRKYVPDGKMVVAGGINTNNIEEIVKMVRPDIVDISSGVEINGLKDPILIENIIKKVRDLT